MRTHQNKACWYGRITINGMKKACSIQILAECDLIVTFLGNMALLPEQEREAGDPFGIKGLGYDMGN